MTRPSYPQKPTLPLLALLALLAACAVPSSIYLSAGPAAPEKGGNPDTALVLLRPFTEHFTADSQIGRHLFTGERQTKLLVQPGSVGRALDALLLQNLTAKKIAAAFDGKAWDQSPAGLAAFAEPNRLIISGRITNLTLNADEKILSGKARLEMDIECILGLINDKKVLRRNVHVAQEMVTVSFDRKDLEKLLAGCLKEASEEILAQCSDLVAFMSLDPLLQPQTTERYEQKFSPGNERTSQTNRGRNPYQNPAAEQRTVSLQSSSA